MDKKETTMNKNTPIFLKILIPIIIVLVIVGIYFIKNRDVNIEETNINEETITENENMESAESRIFELHVTEEIDLEELKSYGLPIMIDFGADSCVPCKEMAPVLEKLNAEVQGKAIILFVDVWKYQDLAVEYPIRVIPTQVFIDSEGNPYTPSETLEIPLMMYTSKENDDHIFTTHEGGMTEEMILEILKEMGVD